MSLSEVMLCCPHCRREYRVSIDLAKLARVTSRASCARCKKVFEITPDRMRGLEIPRARLQEGSRSASDARRDTRVDRDVRIDRSSRPPASRAIERTVPVIDDDAVRAAKRATPISLDDIAPATPGEVASAAAEAPPLAIPRTMSGRLTSRTRSREAVPAAQAAAPVVSDAPVVEPDSDWLVRADPSLATLTAETSEGASALQWLLEQ